MRKTVTDKTIVLDLDETLVHTFRDTDVFRFKLSKQTPVFRRRFLKMDKENNFATVLRPHCEEFLQFCFHYFKYVIIWSAGSFYYVHDIVELLFRDTINKPHVVMTKNEVEILSDFHDRDKETFENLNQQDKEDWFFIFNNENQDNDEDNIFLHKPLNKIWKKQQDITPKNSIIIDNLAINFKYCNPDNGVLIPDYEPKPTMSEINKDDTSLIDLMKWFLKEDVVNSEDVRILDKTKIFVS